MDLIQFAAVAKPQGIKGELKLRLFADSFDSVSEVGSVVVKGVRYDVERFSGAGGEEAIIKLRGLDDRNAAELLRREPVFTDRENIRLPEGRFFIADVIGSRLFLSSGKEIGEVCDIVSGNVDYYYVDTSEGKAVFPLIPELNAKIEPEIKRVTVDAKKFTEVVMYED